MNIIIIDDDPFVCLSLQTILSNQADITVTTTGVSGDDAIRLYRSEKPDILLMDIQMQPVSGLAAGEKILQEDPLARILFLTTFADDEYIAQALQIGAKGYLIKQDIDAIAPALRSVMSGQSVFGGQIVQRFVSLNPSFSAKEHGLNDREAQITRQVALGRNNREIAEALFLSEGTVRNYISTILDKLRLRDRTQLAVFYYQTLQKDR